MSSFFKLSDFASWRILQLFGKVDSGNDVLILQDLRNIQRAEHRHYALDLSQCQGINLRFIMEVARWADWLKLNKGELIFLTPTATVQRSIDIFIGSQRVRHVENTAELSLQIMFGVDRLKRTAAWQKTWQPAVEAQSNQIDNFESSSLKA